MATLKRIESLKPIHYKCIELEIQHPSWSDSKLGEALGREYNTISNWHNSPVYIEARDKRLKEVWHEATKIAQETMINLANNGDYQASKYILDCNNYKPVEKVELSTDKIEIKIED